MIHGLLRISCFRNPKTPVSYTHLDVYKRQPYIQEQLPDINIEFVVGNNDLDFYRFLNENDGLPDIITCCRFSLHDASPLKDSLMDLSTTNAAGACLLYTSRCV